MRHVILILFWGLTTTIQATTPSVSTDSIHTLKHVLKIHLSYPDSALRLLDTMEETNTAPLFLLQAQRAMLYGSHNKHHLVINYGQKALQHDSLQACPKYYLQTLTCCVEAYRKLNEHHQAIHLLEKGLAFARAQKNPTVEANFLFTAGQTYYQLNKKKEANQYFQKAIRLGEEGSYKLKPYLSYFYGEIFSIPFDEGKYQEALEYCDKREKLIQQMSSFKQIPIGYIDQQYAYLYSKKACVLSRLNRKAEAATYYHKFKQTRFSHTPQGQESILVYWMEIGQYDSVIQFCQQQKPHDTITSDYAQQLTIQAKAHEGKKEYKRALEYQKRLTAINDSLNKKNIEEEMAELATIYQLKEKENEIQQQHEQIQKTIIIRNLLAGAFGLVCLLLWMAWHHLRTIQKKNRLMANSINTVLDCEQKIETLEKETSFTQEKEEAEETSVETDSHLFKRMEQIIKEEKLFLNPDLNRQDILNRLPIDKNRFAKIMQENSQTTLPQYLSNLRIKYAINQLKEHPNYTIQAIANESGFSNLRSFQRIFKAKTGMTPSEYKTAIEQTISEK